MVPAFVDALRKLEAQKTELLAQVERWPPEKLMYRPSEADWCVLEMLDHILKTEIAILSTARDGLARPHRIGIGDRLRTKFLERIFTSDRKVKVPVSARDMLPGSVLELNDIRSRWNGSREELSRFVNQADSELLKKGIFKHPVAGWMGMEQILQFFSVHLIHHAYQLSRIARSAALEQA